MNSGLLHRNHNTYRKRVTMNRQKTASKKLNKKLLTATVACVAAAAVGVTTLVHVLQPVEVYAKESFTGTGQIVNAHTGDGEPFLILDIVPSYVTYEWQTTTPSAPATGEEGSSEAGGEGGEAGGTTTTEILEFSTGTLSHLVKGQSVMEREYAAFYRDHASQLKKYADRKAFVDAVWKSEPDPEAWGFRYEEAYESTRKDLESADSISEKGWIKLIDQQTLTEEDQNIGETAHTGQMSGYYLKYEAPAGASGGGETGTAGETGEDKKGYDYNKVGEWTENTFADLKNAVYSFDPVSGTYRLVFNPVDATSASSEQPLSGYLMQSTIRLTGENAGNYSDATGVYVYDPESERYFYMGTLGVNRELFGDSGENGTAATAPTSTASISPGATPSASVSPSPSADPEGDVTPSASVAGSSAPTPTEAADPAQTPMAAPIPTQGETVSPTQTPTAAPIPTQGETVSPTQTPTADHSAVSVTPDQSGSDETDENDSQITETASLNLQQNRQAVLGAVRSAEPTAESVTEPTVEPGTEPTARVQEDGSDDGADPSEYYIVEFQYYDSVTDPSQKVYEIADAQQLSVDAEGAEKPYDAYLLESLPASYGEGTQEDIALLDEGTSTTAPVFLYVGAGLGNYRLIDQSEVSEDYKQENEPVTMEVRNAPTYFRYTGGCDWLKEYVFHSLKDGDNVNENFKLEVRTIRSDQLTKELIEQADLVYLEDGTAPFLNVTEASGETEAASTGAKLHWIGKSGETVTDEETKLTVGMTADNAYALAYRVVNDLLPVMAQAAVADRGELNASNYQALVKLLLKKDPEGYVSAAKTDTDWLIRHLGDEDYPDKTTNNKHYVNRNIYIINGDTPLVNGDFATPFEDSGARSGFAEVLQLIRSENTLLEQEERIGETVSKARAMEYIINYAVGLVVSYPDLRILELQPSSNDSADLYAGTQEDSTTLYFRRSETGAKEKQVLRSASQMKVDVTVRSASAFNSEWTDLNGTYNLIFIGLDGQKLNHTSDLWDTTVYNDTELNGKLYHTGDKAAGSDERYDGVDITVGKRQALLEFLKAGYPVLVENEFFVGRTAKGVSEADINTEYVSDSTQLYQFLKEAVTGYQSQIYTISDVKNDILFRAQTSLDHPVITLSGEAGELTKPQKQENGSYSYTIPYSVKSRLKDSYEAAYTVECYLDVNGDGVFTEKERISDPTVAGEQLKAVNNGNSFTVTFMQEPGSRAMSYLLRVYDNANSYLRSEVQGTLQFTDTNTETIRILQIGSRDGSSLASLYKQTDSVLGYYLQQAEGTLNAHFEITTMSAAEIEAADQAVRATMLSVDPTYHYLDQYDIVLLGFGNGDAAALTDKVCMEVEAYIQAGRSVLISGRGAQEESGRFGLASGLLGQSDGKTYSKLGREHTGGYFRYAGLNAGMFAERSGLSTEGINNGSIYLYPNVVGKTGGFATDTTLRAGDYRLDLTNDPTDTAAAYVTPWFVLTGNGTGTDAYNVSVHDGANNYYLYSKGNVVYIGQQDYTGYTYQAENEDNPVGTGLWESRLFVNAMVLAYNAGVHAPKVDIVAGFEETAAQIESISVPFDVEIASEGDADSGLLDDTVDVYFRYKNSNLAIDKNVQVNFYYEDETGTIQLATGDRFARVTKFDSSISTVEEHTEVTAQAAALRQDKVYRIKAPVEALARHTAATEARIYVEVVSTLQRPDGEKIVRGIDSVILNRTQLFMLE